MDMHCITIKKSWVNNCFTELRFKFDQLVCCYRTWTIFAHVWWQILTKYWQQNKGNVVISEGEYPIIYGFLKETLQPIFLFFVFILTQFYKSIKAVHVLKVAIINYNLCVKDVPNFRTYIISFRFLKFCLRYMILTDRSGWWNLT